MSAVPGKYSLKWWAFVVTPKVPMFLLALPLVVLMRLLRPFIWIRLIPIKDRIGHAAGDVDAFVLEKKMGINQSKGISIFFPYRPEKVNRQMVKLWSRVVPVSTLVYWVFEVNTKIPGGQEHDPQWRLYQSRDIFALTYKTPPQVSFTALEEKQGEVLLRSMGIPKGASFICFQGRDSLYLNQHSPGRDWSYHNYRNFPIEDLALSAEELVRRGYYVVRLGRIVQDKFPFVHPHVIDYANSVFRSDFADIYLISKCYFFVGEGGIEAVARLFRKPVVYINVIPMGFVFTWSEHFLSIFKLLRDKKENKLLGFKEMWDDNIPYALHSKEYERRGLELVENSPQEIRDAIVEMDERLKGQWKATPTQEELQRRFWVDYPLRSDLHGVNKSRIGTLFLEKYQQLLN